MAIKTITVDSQSYDINDARINSLPLPISQGGTGATTAATARTNLGITDDKVGQSPISLAQFVPILAKSTSATSAITTGVGFTSNVVMNPSVGSIKVSGGAGSSSSAASGLFIKNTTDTDTVGGFINYSEPSGNTSGVALVQIGNASNYVGHIKLMNEGEGGNEIISRSGSSVKQVEIPNVAGSFAIGSTTGVGDSSTPVYLDAAGELKACTDVAASDTKVTQTGTTGNANYSFLLTNAATATVATGTSTARFRTNSYLNTSTGRFNTIGPANTSSVSSAGYALYDSDSGSQVAVLHNSIGGTASTIGEARLLLGNSTASGTAGNAKGIAYIYGESTKYNSIESAASSTNKNNILPNVSGYLAVGATAGVGGSSTPIYLDANGELQECTNVSSSDTKVTKAVSTVGLHNLLADVRTGSQTADSTGTAVIDSNVLLNSELHYMKVYGNAATSASASGYRVYDESGDNIIANLYHRTQGTTSTTGVAYLVLGNSTASGTVNNAKGGVALYGTGTAPNYLHSGNTGDTNYYNNLPMSSGYLVTAGTSSTISALGSTTKGVYMDASGHLEACSYTLGQNVSSSAKLTDTYVSAAAWVAGAASGPKLQLTRSGSTTTAVTSTVIPSASADASGVVTTGAQTFAGVKTFATTVYFANTTTYYLGSSGNGRFNNVGVGGSLLGIGNTLTIGATFTKIGKRLVGTSGAVTAGNYTTSVPTAAGVTGQIMFVLT